MSYLAPFVANPAADTAAAEVDIFLESNCHAIVSSPAAADALRRIEEKYQQVVQLLEDEVAALAEDKEAAAAKIEALETGVCALEGDLVTLEAVLRDGRWEMEGVFVQTHIVPEKKVVLRVGEEMWSGVFKWA